VWASADWAGLAPRRVLARRVAPASMDMMIRLFMAVFYGESGVPAMTPPA
jgi:hypothetical protein